jgi:NAD(P)H-flavin reductase
MVEALLARPSIPPMLVVHGVASVADLAFRDRLEFLAREGIVTYVPIVSRPGGDGNEGWTGATGHVDALLTRLVTGASFAPDRTVAYICGNPGVIASTRVALASLGLPPESIRFEEYWPGQRALAEDGAESDPALRVRPAVDARRPRA